ncbi:type II toxin-antitoxin system RelB family antitoxin [Avibacterium endocarditidis]|uniref:type II toxin-antitoxin system RelB family antitoxin n=1 Tax=Avibacterium TaxID=292486 RepID=UPI0039FDD741
MTITVRLPDELQRRLDHLAIETGRAKSFYIKQALEAYLEDLEDLLLANATLERVRSGKEKTYTLKDVENELNLDGDIR